CHTLFLSFLFSFTHTVTTKIYTLSLHDALPIYYDQFLATGKPILIATSNRGKLRDFTAAAAEHALKVASVPGFDSLPQVLEDGRSEEHTSELQSQSNIVCRLMLEKKHLEILLVQ